MNYLKVETEVLKRLMKEKKVIYQKEEDGYWLLNTQATFGVFVPKNFMFIDVENSRASEETEAFSKLYRKEFTYNKAKLSGMSKIMHDPIKGDIECAEVITLEGDTVRAWIDKKFLKYLDADARFLVKAPEEVVMVKEYKTGDKVVAIICSVRDR